MTAKEKAIDIINRFNSIDVELDSREGVYSSDLGYLKISKQCALIAVEEIIETNVDESIYGSAFSKYWKEVKQEIEKL